METEMITVFILLGIFVAIAIAIGILFMRSNSLSKIKLNTNYIVVYKSKNMLCIKRLSTKKSKIEHILRLKNNPYSKGDLLKVIEQYGFRELKKINHEKK